MAPTPRLPEQLFEQIPAVLLGGVNLVRALGLAGIPAIVVTHDPDEPALSSRYCVARCMVPAPVLGEAAVEAIVAIGDQLALQYGRRVPLFYGNDDWLKLIYAHRDEFQRHFLLMLSGPEVANALLTKDAFQAFAQKRGLPVPAALTWNAAESFDGPVVVKPSNKDGWKDSPLRKRAFGDAKALVFANGAEAAADPVLTHYRDQLTLQQYIPGGDECNWSYHGFADAKGHVVECFVGRKLRTCPPGNGESAYIELQDNEELRKLGARLAACMPLKGIFKMDFKQDARTGRWYLLEVNARFNLWQYLGAANGVNLMATAYQFLLEGTRPEPVAARNDTRWLSFELDRRAYRDLRAEGKLGLVAWLASIAFARKVYNVFSWSDPGPWLAFWWRRAGRLAYKAPNRVFSLLRQWRSTAS